MQWSSPAADGFAGIFFGPAGSQRSRLGAGLPGDRATRAGHWKPAVQSGVVADKNRFGGQEMEVALSRARVPQRAAEDGLSAQQLIEIYRLMFLSRRVDDREILLKRQQKIYFQVSAAGHEAVQVGAALALRPGYDWFFPYYRDRALCLALGVSPYQMYLQAAGSAADEASGGRQMPSHWSSRALHIVSTSSCTGSQVLHAVGFA